MCDRISTWLKDAAVENGPIPLGARALATRMRDLGTGYARPDISLCRESAARMQRARLGSETEPNAGVLDEEVFTIPSMMFRIGGRPQALRLRRTASRLRGLTAPSYPKERAIKIAKHRRNTP